MTQFAPATPRDRESATTFAGKVARWGPTELVRLNAADPGIEGADGVVELWARTAFGVLTRQHVAGTLSPSPTVVYAVELVAALAVSTAAVVDPGQDVSDQWRASLPPADGWSSIGVIDPNAARRHIAAGTEVARAESDEEQRLNPRPSTKATVSPRLLDSVMLTLSGAQEEVPIPLRMLFALSGMGLLDELVDEPIRVQVTASWLRLDTPDGSVMRRRMPNLPVVDLGRPAFTRG